MVRVAVLVVLLVSLVEQAHRVVRAQVVLWPFVAVLRVVELLAMAGPWLWPEAQPLPQMVRVASFPIRVDWERGQATEARLP